MEITEFVPLKNNLASHSIFHKVVNEIVEKIKILLPEIHRLKMDCELTKLIANAVTNMLSPQQEKSFDKTEIIVAIFVKLFPDLKDTELDQVRSQIEFLENNKQVKRISSLKYIKKHFSAWVLRRLG
jgi:hypothetical protein